MPNYRGLEVGAGAVGGGAPPDAAAPVEFIWAPLIAAPEPRLPSGLWRAGVSAAFDGRGLWVAGAGCAAVPVPAVPDDCPWAPLIAAPDCRFPSGVRPVPPWGACARVAGATSNGTSSARPAMLLDLMGFLHVHQAPRQGAVAGSERRARSPVDRFMARVAGLPERL